MTIKKVALGILGAIVGLVSLALVWAFLSYPAGYLTRSVLWGDADVYDYQRFPSRAASLKAVIRINKCALGVT
jgi:hypothetical protein